MRSISPRSMVAFIVTCCVTFMSAATSAAAPIQLTKPYDFVQEYIRELGGQEALRADAEAASKVKDANTMSNGIYYSTRVEQELRTDIGILAGMHLTPPVDGLPAMLVGYYNNKIEVHDRLIDIFSQMMSGPKPGVDYSEIAVRMPKLRAALDSIDEEFMQLSTLAFASLIDSKPDKAGHMSRLVVTKAERLDLLHQVRREFGSKLDQKQQNYYVSAASVLASYLDPKKGYHCADEPE